MRRFIIILFVILGILALIGALIFAGIGLLSMDSKPSISSRTVLEIDFERGLVEAVSPDPLAQLMGTEVTTVRDVVAALLQGAQDDKVRGLVARIGSGGLGMAHIQEIRDAVETFRASGKPTVAFAESFGEFGPGNGGYYLATAFDRIVLQPSGDVGLTGLGYEAMFIRGTLDKLDIEAHFDQRHEFKNAMNTYTHTEFTEPHERALREMMDSQFDQMVRGIAEARELTEERVRELFDNGPYLGAEALDVGLVDELAYRDQVYDQIRNEAGARSRLMYLKRYLDGVGELHDRGTTVALIHATGAVTRGASAFSPLTGQATMGSDTVAAALRSAIRDDRVKAIVLRVDSPGGSYIASDTIYRETIRAREAGKPVVVTMANVAASGGYFVAMEADRIVAQPGTITGSIGVLGGKMNTTGLWNRLGISWDAVRTSENSEIYSAIDGYDEAEWERFQAGLNRIYDDFTTKAAAGRGMPVEDLREVAKGRIWTGEDALEIGLVDALGGYETAFDLTREVLDLEEDAPLRLKAFPRPVSPFDALFGKGPDSSEESAVRSVVRALEPIQPVLAELERAGVLGQRGVLSMPWVPQTP